MKVPFVDLHAMHEEVRPALEAAFQDILDRSSFIGGSYVDTFEKDFASFCGVKNAIACASGTDALKLALMAAGVRQGDAVITVPNTFIATVEAITMIGATPIFVDIDKQTYHLSPFLLEEYLENNTRLGIGGHRIDGKTGKTIIAVLPVHLFGMMVDMKPILEIAAKYNLVVVEDCAQAHGATYTLDGTTYKAGTLGVTAGFSFYPGKNLGALGEGGAVTTNDINVANFMRMLRDHGSNQKYIHTTPDGWNSRLDALQCAFLDIKLKNLDEWNMKRREAANLYQKFLKGFDQIIIPFVPEGREHVYHLFVVRVKNRDEVMKSLAESGISCGLHYPVPLHLQVAYRDLGYTKGDFPESETAAAEILSLPMFPHINSDMIEYVCEQLLKCNSK